MSEPRRLSSTSPNPLTRALLDAGREEGPSQEARMSAAMAIGIAGGLATTAAAGGAAAGTGTATAVASKWLGTAGVLKLVGATIVSGALVVGAVHEHRQVAARAASSARPAAAIAARAVTASPVRPAPPAERPIEATAPPGEASATGNAPAAVVEPTPSRGPRAPLAGALSSAPARLAMGAPRVSAPVSGEASLHDEVQRLDRARASLADGHTAEAREHVDAYDRAYPRGALRDEAELLRIEAIAQAGNVLAATAGAERLLARDEHGPHARRVRALLASLRRDSGAR